MPADTPNPDPWGRAWFLVDEAERTKGRFARLHKWDSAVRIFRQIEQQRLFEQDPTERDLREHETLLMFLIGVGLRVQLFFDEMHPGEFKVLEINPANLAAAIQELKDTYFGWHGPELSPERKTELEQKIFGGAA